MATLAELVADGTPFLDLEAFAETISFTPAAGSPTAIIAVVTRSDRRIEKYDDGDYAVLQCRIHAKTSDVSTLESVGDGCRFTIDGVDWAVDAIPKKDVGITTVDVIRREPLERSRRDFRQQR